MNFMDLTGQKFGKLTVLERAEDHVTPNGKHQTQWLCKCDCGNTSIVSSQKLRNGHTKSCGCAIHENKSQNFVDITGKRYGRLTVVGFIDWNKRRVKDRCWLCKCDCGNHVETSSSRLKNGRQQSCGCFKEEMKPWLGIITTKYKYKNKRLYGVWQSMIKRVSDERVKCYKNYGGRGIKVCDEWSGEYGYDAFAEWAFSNGYDDKAERGELTLDRIDVNGNYEPSNCRWISNSEQQYNKRTNVMLEYNGESRCMKEWSHILNVPYGFIVYHCRKKDRSVAEMLEIYRERKSA